MQHAIHPKYEEIKVICSCGNKFTTASTKGGKELKVEVCSNCHPFYTGQKQKVSSKGRVEEFMKRHGRGGSLTDRFRKKNR